MTDTKPDGPSGAADGGVEGGPDVDAAPTDAGSPCDPNVAQSCRTCEEESTCSQAVGENQNPVCGGAKLCPDVRFPIGFDAGASEAATTMTNAQCMLQAYRDDKVGNFVWSEADSVGSGYSASYVVELLPQRRAHVQVHTQYDLNGTDYDLQGFVINDAGFFTDCLTKSTLDDLRKCFEQASPITACH
jgi:hypothetical protein